MNVSDMSLGERATALKELRGKLLERQGFYEYVELLEDAAAMYRQLGDFMITGGRLWRLILEQDG